MYLQTYVLPKWEEFVAGTDLPKHIEDKYRNIAELMTNYLDDNKIRDSAPRIANSWVSTHFAAVNDDRELLINRLIAKHFSKFITNYKRKSSSDVMSSNELQKIIQIQEELDLERKRKLDRFQEVKQEVQRLRKERRNRRQKTVKVKKVVKKPKPKPVNELKELDFDQIYDSWMKHVESKQETQNISKSYWYIHEYIGRFILKFARERNKTVIDEEAVQAFLDDYGKGKRPKTMNHYNRVAKYFLQFCLDLQRN